MKNPALHIADSLGSMPKNFDYEKGYHYLIGYLSTLAALHGAEPITPVALVRAINSTRLSQK